MPITIDLRKIYVKFAKILLFYYASSRIENLLDFRAVVSLIITLNKTF